MTPAEAALDALCEECRVYMRGYDGEPRRHKLFDPAPEGITNGLYNQVAVALNAFPAGARARLLCIVEDLALLGTTKLEVSKLQEADRLVSECERLQRGEAE